MTRADADVHFAAFARSGDPAALAKVFDLLAGELLLVAAHLAPRGVEPEDLLQATFVRAIEQRARFAPGRPVRPWLVGILGNLAREARKRGDRAPDPHRLQANTDRTPDDHAQTAEAEATVAQAVASLPRLDRQVLTLRLVHGMTDAQIAHALAVPLPTAKARLRRGLVRLRQTLPQGLAQGMAVFEAGRNLRSVRAQVLAAAAAAVPATLAWGTGVQVAVLAAALLLGGLGWVWSRARNTEPEVPPQASHLEAIVAAPSAAPTPEVAVPERTELPQLATHAPTPTRVDGIRGRSVARESGLPLPGCTVVARLQPPFPASLDETAAFARLPQRPVRATSAGDGTFTLPLPLGTERFGLTLTFAAEHRAAAALTVSRTEAACDLGDVPLARTVPVQGHIVDTHGAPLLGARVSFRSPLGLQRDALQDLPGEAVPSHADGRFTVSSGLAPGTWLVSTHDGTLISPLALVVEADAVHVELEVVVLRRDPNDKLAGVVHDHVGQPLDGVMVNVESETHGARTDARGAFSISRATGADAPACIRLQDVQGRAARTTIPGPFAWGRTDLALTMPPAESVRVRVVEASGNQPVTAFEVHVLPRTSLQAAEPPPRPEPGVVVVPGVDWGVTSVAIVPEDQGLEPSGIVRLAPDALVGGELRVPLRRRGTLRVRVRRADGNPVVGSRVDVLVDEDHGLPTNFAAESLPLAQCATNGWAALFTARCGLAVTDSEGCATLNVAPATTGRAVRVRGDHPPLVLRHVGVRPGVTLDVTVTEGARVHGRVVPLHLLRELSRAAPPTSTANDPLAALTRPGLFFRPAAGAASMLPIPLDEDGRFTVADLPPGPCDVSFNRFLRSPGGSGNVAALLATITLRPGEQELTLDLEPARPATLEALVIGDDRPCAAANVTLRRPMFMVTVRCDARGAFTLQGLDAGTYRAFVEDRDRETGRTLWVPSVEVCELRPGARAQARFHVVRRQARVRVLLPDGRTPATHRRFLVQEQLQLPPWPVATDAGGWLTLDPAPFGPFTLRAAVEEGPGNWVPAGAATGRVELPLQGEATVTVCLTAGG